MINKEIKQLILYRLDSIPRHYKLSVGGKGTYNKEELRKHIEDEDEIGRAFITMQLNFIKAIANGKLSETLAA